MLARIKENEECVNKESGPTKKETKNSLALLEVRISFTNPGTFHCSLSFCNIGPKACLKRTGCPADNSNQQVTRQTEISFELVHK